MPTNRVEAAFSPLYLTLGAAALAGSSDVELLGRFTAGGGMGEAAFAALVQRHGPSVMRVCRCVLRHTQDAEDAFQATFLVLAAKANSLSLRGPLTLWLHAVARRVSFQARTAAERRRQHERRAAKSEAVPVETPLPDLAAEVLESVGRLPERFRTVVILCDLEGLTYAEAADRLGWTHATVRNRLARGRERLRVALTRKGLAPVMALAAGAVPPVSRALTAATVRAAAGVAAGAACEGVPASVVVLMSGGLRAMLLTKLQTVWLTVLVAAAVVAGAHGLTARGPAERVEQAKPAPEAPANQPAKLPHAWVAKLAMPVPIDNPINGMMLKDMLAFLSAKCDVSISVKTAAFEAAGSKAVEKASVRLPKIPGATLGLVLRFILAQLPVPGEYRVRDDYLEVVPHERANKEKAGDEPLPAGAGSVQPPADPGPQAERIVAKLMAPIAIDKPIEGMTLKDMLAFLSEKYNVTIILNGRSFWEAGDPNIEEAIVRLPKMSNTSLQTLLRHVLTQLPSQGKCLVREGHLELVTATQAQLEAFGKLAQSTADIRMIQPLVNIVCERRSLAGVLADIARQSNRNVILDPRVTDPDKRLVTATLLNAPTDTAVRVLAELANLKAVQWDNVFFVTTPEFAAELRKDEGQPAPPVPPKGPPKP